MMSLIPFEMYIVWSKKYILLCDTKPFNIKLNIIEWDLKDKFEEKKGDY